MSDRKINNLLVAVNRIRDVYAEMPAQMLAVFLSAAMNEGLSISEIGDKAGVPIPASSSRLVKDLSRVHGLLTVAMDEENNRKRVVRLTKAGKKLVEDLVTLV
jgi:DNA-binding MarR family transcriptional regulator